MAKFLYTISQHACVVVESNGQLPLNVVHWLASTKFYEVSQLNFILSFIEKFGYKAKFSTYFVTECLDVRGQVCYASTGQSSESSLRLLFNIMPQNIILYLKNPAYDKTARNLLARYQSHEAL